MEGGTPPERRLIVTADDFGCSAAVNEAVRRAHREGILGCASLMVRGEAAVEAAAVARENPGLGVGVHLDFGTDSPAAWGLRHFLRRDLARGLAAEIEAQVRRCLALGIEPTHLDSHCNVHVHPVVFPLLVDAARRFRIARIRLTGGEWGLWRGFPDGGLAGKAVLSAVFGALGAWLRPRAQGLVVPDRTLGLLRSGMMTEDYLLWLIPRLPGGLTELYCHPTADPAAKGLSGPAPSHHSCDELGALVSPRVREAVERAGVRLVGRLGTGSSAG